MIGTSDDVVHHLNNASTIQTNTILQEASLEVTMKFDFFMFFLWSKFIGFLRHPMMGWIGGKYHFNTLTYGSCTVCYTIKKTTKLHILAFFVERNY